MYIQQASVVMSCQEAESTYHESVIAAQEINTQEHGSYIGVMRKTEK